MAEPAESLRKPALMFLIAGSLAAGAAWATFAGITHVLEGARSVPAIKLVIGSGTVSSESEMSWASVETELFKEYCRVRGWGEVDVNVTTAVGDYFQKYIASTIAGEGADVIMVGSGDVCYFADHGLIEPLDEYVENWDAYRDGHIDEDFLEMSRGIDGKILGLTFSEVGPAFFTVRRDWLENLGLEAPDTFEEAYALWRAFTFDDPDGNGKDDTYGYAISMQTARGDHVSRLSPFMQAACVNWYDIDEDGRVVPAFNTPDAAFILDFIKKAYEEGLFGKDVMFRTERYPIIVRFAREQAAGMCGGLTPNYYKTFMMRYGIYDKLQIVPFLWKDEEARRGNRYSTSSGLSSYRCIMKDSRNKETAWRYLEFWFSHEHMQQLFSISGLASTRSRYLGRFGVYEGTAGWSVLRNDIDIEVKVDDEIERVVRPLDRYVIIAPTMTAWSEISVAMSEVFVDYYVGQNYASAQDALDEAERRFIEIFKAYERQLNVDRDALKKRGGPHG